MADFSDPDAFFNAHGTAERFPPGGRRSSLKNDDQATRLQNLLSIQAWAVRDIPEPDCLLGHIVTTTTRMFLVGQTGLGKTMLALEAAIAMASGRGFLRWPSSRAARVLYFDGEMPGELIKGRCCDALRRLGLSEMPGSLVIYSSELEAEIAHIAPEIGKFAPLNTPEGAAFVLALVDALGGVDAIVFDNVMSLIVGDNKEEMSWSDTLPLVQTLTHRKIGQIWCDHTGHNTTRQYGSSTKSWRFDVVAVMEALPEDERDPQELAFKLSFSKCRRRTPDNWRDFESCVIRLRGEPRRVCRRLFCLSYAAVARVSSSA